jgi:transcription elongation factor GreA
MEKTMVDEPTHLTREGYEKLESELEHLHKVRRVEVAERLRRALEEGGELVENAEYEDAKNEQAFVEGRIQYLEQILSTAQLIANPDGPIDTVQLGSTVTVQENGRKPETFYMVGAVEANPREGRISNESPLGRALMGHEVGDEVTINAPDGPLIFKIKSIK